MTEITQADRDAAAAFYGTWGGTKGWQHLEEPIRKGLVDDNALVQAFARHREQAEQETVAKIVAWLRDEVEAHPVTEYASFAAAIACSIKAGEWK